MLIRDAKTDTQYRTYDHTYKRLRHRDRNNRSASDTGSIQRGPFGYDAEYVCLYRPVLVARLREEESAVFVYRSRPLLRPWRKTIECSSVWILFVC